MEVRTTSIVGALVLFQVVYWGRKARLLESKPGLGEDDELSSHPATRPKLSAAEGTL